MYVGLKKETVFYFSPLLCLLLADVAVQSSCMWKASTTWPSIRARVCVYACV